MIGMILWKYFGDATFCYFDIFYSFTYVQDLKYILYPIMNQSQVRKSIDLLLQGGQLSMKEISKSLGLVYQRSIESSQEMLQN